MWSRPGELVISGFLRGLARLWPAQAVPAGRREAVRMRAPLPTSHVPPRHGGDDPGGLGYIGTTHLGLAGEARHELGTVVLVRHPVRIPAIEKYPPQQLREMRGEIRGHLHAEAIPQAAQPGAQHPVSQAAVVCPESDVNICEPGIRLADAAVQAAHPVKDITTPLLLAYPAPARLPRGEGPLGPDRVPGTGRRQCCRKCRARR
jgi:hypothetical protein